MGGMPRDLHLESVMIVDGKAKNKEEKRTDRRRRGGDRRRNRGMHLKYRKETDERVKKKKRGTSKKARWKTVR